MSTMTSRMTKAVDWQSGLYQQECNKYMLENQIDCDVCITFGHWESSKPKPFNDDDNLKAHSYMLKSRSCEFQSLLKTAPKREDGCFMITESHVNKDTFTEVLRYIYHGGAELKGHNVLHVMQAAKQYCLSGLISQCEEFLEDNLDNDSVCSILSQSVLYKEEVIAAKCVKYIAEEITNVLQSTDFVNLTKEALDNFFESEYIITSSFTELELFNACICWAKKRETPGDEQGLRKILGKFLFKIRFPLMTPDELAKIIDTWSDLLTLKEQALLLLYVVQPMDHIASKIEMLGFSVRRRIAGSNEMLVTPSRFPVTGGSLSYNGGTCEICFKVDQPIQFVGISLYGGLTAKDEHKVILSLSTDVGVRPITSLETTIVSQGTEDPIQIKFPTAIPLQKDNMYVIRTLITGPDSYCGQDGSNHIGMSGVHFTFIDIFTCASCVTCAEQSACPTSVEDGQIPQILFRKY